MSEENSEELNKLFSELAGSATMSPLDAQSHEMHEMFLSLMRVGFSERQALFIISMAVITMDIGEDEEEIVISPSPDHPSNRDGSTGNSERHPNTAGLSDDEDDEDEDEDSSL